MNQQKDLMLIERIRAFGDENAKEELVKKYLPMVRFIVKNQNSFRFDYEDILQEGAIGLLKAIDEYDYENYPIKFSTFAYICILRRIYNVIKQSFTKKSLFSNRALSLYTSFSEDDPRTILDSITDYSTEPFSLIENDWVGEKIDLVLAAFLSPIEYQVLKMILLDYNIRDIQKQLDLSIKVIDNARTRARLKLKKVLFKYGSFLNPEIPSRTRKRKDLSISLEVG